MFLRAFKKAYDVIRKKPMMLWGLSLLYVLLCILAGILTTPIIALGLAVQYVLAAGMSKIYLDGLDGKAVNSDQLFSGFGRFFRVAGGMAWRDLWLLIWCLIPVAGPVIAVIKSYSYAFVPYILMDKPEISATEALRISMKMTTGQKGQMFLADLIFAGGSMVIAAILGLLTMIPYIGLVFGLVLVLFVIALTMFGGLFAGLYRAYFYKNAFAPSSYTF